MRILTDPFSIEPLVHIGIHRVCVAAHFVHVCLSSVEVFDILVTREAAGAWILRNKTEQEALMQKMSLLHQAHTWKP